MDTILVRVDNPANLSVDDCVTFSGFKGILGWRGVWTVKKINGHKALLVRKPQT